MKKSHYQRFSIVVAALVIALITGVGIYIVYRSQAVGADISGDGVVGIADLSILGTHFGQSGQTFVTGDISGDGKVGIADLSMLASAWGTKSTSPITLVPTEDSHVLNGFDTAGNPSSNTNYNFAKFLRADVGERASCGLPTNNITPCWGHHDRLSYIKFNLTSLPFTPSSAKLRLYVTSGDYCSFGNQRHIVHQTSDNSWSESTITWNNKPDYNPTSLGENIPLVADTYFELPVAVSAIHAGTMSLVVENTWLCHRTFDSRETAHPPQLVINP